MPNKKGSPLHLRKTDSGEKSEVDRNGGEDQGIPQSSNIIPENSDIEIKLEEGRRDCETSDPSDSQKEFLKKNLDPEVSGADSEEKGIDNKGDGEAKIPSSTDDVCIDEKFKEMAFNKSEEENLDNENGEENDEDEFYEFVDQQLQELLANLYESTETPVPRVHAAVLFCLIRDLRNVTNPIEAAFGVSSILSQFLCHEYEQAEYFRPFRNKCGGTKSMNPELN